MNHYAFAIIDLPIQYNEKVQYLHDIKIDGNKNVNIKTGYTTIILRDKMKESKCNLENHMIMLNRYELAWIFKNSKIQNNNL